MEIEQYRIDKDADTNNTSLAQILSPELQRVVEDFPSPDGEFTAASPSLDEPERGFDGAEWRFIATSDETVFSCYRRWDVMRVSVKDGDRHRVNDFILWLFAVGRHHGLIKAKEGSNGQTIR